MTFASDSATASKTEISSAEKKESLADTEGESPRCLLPTHHTEISIIYLLLIAWSIATEL